MSLMRNFLFTVAVASGIAATGCVVRGSGTATITSTPVVYSEPPAPKVEPVRSNAGHVWIRGRWDWRNGQWFWVAGHWERERAGYGYSEGRWERRGNSWHWIEGTWTVTSTTTNVRTEGGAPAQPDPNASGGITQGGPTRTTTTTTTTSMYPTAAPPPPRAETIGTNAGYIWIRGRWDWKNGQWEWVGGHWERPRAASRWVDGRWELQGNYYVWIEGRWDAASAPDPVRDHRK